MVYCYGYLGSRLMLLGLVNVRGLNSDAAALKRLLVATEFESSGYSHCWCTGLWHENAAARPWRGRRGRRWTRSNSNR